jgi:hypothetical protein
LTPDATIFTEFGKMGGLQRGAVKFPWALSEVNPQTRAQVPSRHPARLLYRPFRLPRYRCRTAPLRTPHPRNDYPPVPGEAILLGAYRFLTP